jgi:cytoskeletal protein CcmA (bactofilin family)
MFKRNTQPSSQTPAPVERVTSVLGAGINWTGKISGKGGVRIEGIFEGEIGISGLVVVGETGKVTCDNVRANSVIVAGAVHGGITAEKLEIRSTGRVWGNVVVSAFSTEEGAFLRGQVTMEDSLDLGLSDTGELKVLPEENTEENPG